jgi:hypothetical protein
MVHTNATNFTTNSFTSFQTRILAQKIVDEFVRFNSNVRTKFVVVDKALIGKICNSFWMIFIKMERKHLVASCSSTINKCK